MAGMTPALEAVHHISQAGAALGQVGGVDLRDIAQADHLGAGAGAGDQRLHLLGRQVLRLVYDQVFVEEGAAAHEVQRFDLDAGANQIARRGAAPVAAIVIALVEHVQIVLQRPHPRRHFLLFGARQEADVLAHRHGDPGHDDFGVQLLFQRHRQAGGQRQQRLAGTGLTQQRDEVHLRIHQQIESEVLLAIARGDAPDIVFVVAVVLQRLQHRGLAFHLGHSRLQRLGAFLPQHLVDVEILAVRAFDLVVAAALFLPGFHVLAVALPEALVDFPGAGVQQVGVFQHLVVEIVFRVQA